MSVIVAVSIAVIIDCIMLYRYLICSELLVFMALQLAPATACGFKRDTAVETARQQADFEFEAILKSFGDEILKNDYNYKLSDKAGM